MKRMAIGILLLLAVLPLSGRTRTPERVYVSTDRDCYVAGERIWCSAFCVTPEGRLSELSALVKVELHGPDFMAAASRIALEGGRGGGYLDLPLSMPTGNYRLVAYTGQNEAESGYDYNGVASKVLSVFNVLTDERLPGGVRVVRPEEYESLRTQARPAEGRSDTGGVTLRWEDGALLVDNASPEAVSLNLSVFHDDAVVPNANPDITAFMQAVKKLGPASFDDRRITEFEGEIIRGRVVGYRPDMAPALIGKYAYLSSPSDKSDIYAAPVLEDGSLVFYTANIYGDKEFICEIEGIDPRLECHVELASPYVNAAVAPVPQLALCPSLAEALSARSVAMQLERRFAADTLRDFLPRRGDGLFDEETVVRYVLDDYTRFTTMEEVIVEIVSELRIRRQDDGTRALQVYLKDAPSAPVLSTGKVLTLLDGVPVFDHRKILEYDPLLVASVDVYPRTHFIGNRVFEGVVNFVTYRHNLPGLKFDENARVVDYQGVCLPMAATGENLPQGNGYPDYRQTVYWHPLLTLPAGGSLRIECRMPRYKGRFEARLEGLSADGTPVCSRTSFDLR